MRFLYHVFVCLESFDVRDDFLPKAWRDKRPLTSYQLDLSYGLCGKPAGKNLHALVSFSEPSVNQTLQLMHLSMLSPRVVVRGGGITHGKLTERAFPWVAPLGRNFDIYALPQGIQV